jgi:hypothetical protein
MGTRSSTPPPSIPRKARQGSEAGGGALVVVAYEPETEADAFARRRRQSWARLIRKAFEGFPLTCPRCGGEMKVVSVITDIAVIDRILRHLRKKSRAPPEDNAGEDAG